MNDFRNLMHRPIAIQKVEVLKYDIGETVVSEGVTGLIRQRRGLSKRSHVEHLYLRLCTSEGLEGWSGPMDVWSNVTISTLTETLRFAGEKTSIAKAAELLKPLWWRNPTSCAAVDCALWDLVCRREGKALYQALADQQGKFESDPPFYGSILGLSLEHLDALAHVFEVGYPIAKWSLNDQYGITEQLTRIRSLGIALDSIALDAHGKLSLAQVNQIHQLAPDIAWLEDPFQSDDEDKWIRTSTNDNNQLPRLVVGEDVSSINRLEKLAALPAVNSISLEMERLGITKAVSLIRKLRLRGRPCHLHGRAVVPSSHLAIAFPDVVQWVENHIAFLIERFATLYPAGPTSDARTVVRFCLKQQGIGVSPHSKVKPSIFRIKY